MGQHIVKQPNGKYAIFSSIVDQFIAYDASVQECYAHFREHAITECDRRTARSLELADASADRFMDDIRRIRSVHGDAEADNALIACMRADEPRDYQATNGARRHNARKKKLGAFKDELVALYRKHGVSIGHEDNHGAFIIRDLRESDIRWIQNATNHATEPLEHTHYVAAIVPECTLQAGHKGPCNGIPRSWCAGSGMSRNARASEVPR